jgi:palmitoyltransferase
MFTIGMTGSSLQFVLINSSTIENLSRKTIVWTLALYMPRLPETPPGFRTISYSTQQVPEGSNASSDQAAGAVRTFAILHTKPGENPFDLGPYQNFKTVMGEHWYDWFLAIRYSPCCYHDAIDGQFAMGPVVQRMRREAGIQLPEEVDEKKTHRRRRHRRRRHRSDTAASREVEMRHDYNPNEKARGNNGNEVDLESGLGHTNGTVQ